MSTRERDNRRLLRRIREYHTASDSVMGMRGRDRQPQPHRPAHGPERTVRHPPASTVWRRKRSGTRPAYVRNHLERDFTATEPNTKWVTDITYIHTAGGWLYPLRRGRPVRGQGSRLVDVDHAGSPAGRLRAVLMVTCRGTRPNRLRSHVLILHSDRGLSHSVHVLRGT